MNQVINFVMATPHYYLSCRGFAFCPIPQIFSSAFNFKSPCLGHKIHRTPSCLSLFGAIDFFKISCWRNWSPQRQFQHLQNPLFHPNRFCGGSLEIVAKMNDLMTKSFLSYVELKKQAMKDLEAEPDIEMGQLEASDEQNLSRFFEEVAAIKADMEEITNFLIDIRTLNEEAKSTHSVKILRGFRDRISSDMVAVRRKAKLIKTKLESLDQSNTANRILSDAYKDGSPVDRTRFSVTNGLRVKLRGMMNDFQSLREQILKEHKEELKRGHYNATGVEPSEEAIEKMISGGNLIQSFEGKLPELAMENQERNEAVKELQKSLKELHQLFLDMAVMVETQGEKINDIEENVARAGDYVNGGTKKLQSAKQMKRKSKWVSWIGIVLLIFVLICLIPILAK
ncbi:syntaxin-112-like [Malania oleifera]|uniref:syntaxin-112-like n=1 Tax=Malania oleifera TaxID=397392 RepID=UPI0025ADD90E|nr:syntaxin-112-like [Malania oleifera]